MGVINVENVDNIVGARMVGISSRIILYLNEFLLLLLSSLVSRKHYLRIKPC